MIGFIYWLDRKFRNVEAALETSPEEKVEISLRKYRHEKLELEHSLTETKYRLAAINEHIERCQDHSDSNVIHIIKRLSQ